MAILWKVPVRMPKTGQTMREVGGLSGDVRSRYQIRCWHTILLNASLDTREVKLISITFNRCDRLLQIF